MNIGQHYLEVGLGVATIVAVAWYTYPLYVNYCARREAKLRPKPIVRQPWTDDKAGGRGNR